MILSNFARWRRFKSASVVLIVFTIIILCIFNSRSSSSIHSKKTYDINLLTKLCNQRFALFRDTQRLPQWMIDNQRSNRLLTESDKVSHIYGPENEMKYEMQGDTSLKDNVWDGLPVRGAFYMLVRNEELGKVRDTMRSIEDRFNSKLTNGSSYPYIFLNSQRFTPEFKKYARMVSSNPDQVYFGQIDLDAWSFPYWIDSHRADTAMVRLEINKVEHGISQYFHQAARYQTGLYAHHPLFENVDYVWHVEAGTTYTCEMFQSDPFQTMQINKKKIGFTLTGKENPKAMVSLWPACLHYMRRHSHSILPPDETIMPWLMTAEKEYNKCNIWTSFQIVDLSFIRSNEYQLFFHYLDHVGGFFYERWTEGPVRSIAAAMFLKRQEIHYFNEVGFDRDGTEHCPYSDKILKRCTCDFQKSNDYSSDSCTVNLLKYINMTAIDGMINFIKLKQMQDQTVWS